MEEKEQRDLIQDNKNENGLISARNALRRQQNSEQLSESFD